MTTNDASGYIADDFKDTETEFCQISVMHTSARNVVYKARRYGKWWCLKGVADSANNTASRMALAKEFDLLIRAQGHGCVNAYSMETVRHLGTCMVMEYVEGVTLRQWLDGNPGRSERVRMATSLVNLVGDIHARGVVHRDIKPSNIIVERTSGLPLLIDFGLADTLSYAIGKSPAGTEKYMSPEQKSDTRPDRRNDLYSLAIVLETMRLPYYWRPTIKKCQRRINERCANAEEMMRNIRNTHRWATLGMILAAALLMLGVFTLSAHRDGGQSSPDIPMATEVASDSAVASHAASVNEPLRQSAYPSTDQSSIQPGGRHEVIDQYESALYRVMDAAWLAYISNLPDTITEPDMQQLNETTGLYLQSVSASLQPDEIAELRTRIENYKIKLKSEWMKAHAMTR